MKNYKAPTHLSKQAKKIYRTVMEEWKLCESEQILLVCALESYDRAQQARLQIEKSGLFFKTPSGQIKPHPSLKVERESKALFLNAWRMLKLEETEIPQPAGRPPRDWSKQ